ncbi:sensor histidine kinase [Actinomycetospora sp. C-140]
MTSGEPRTLLDRFLDSTRARPIATDTALAVLVALLGVLEARSTHNVRALQDESTVAVLVTCVPIVLRRRYPLPAAIVTAVLAAASVLIVNGVGIELPALVMAYSVIVHGPRWIGPVAAAVLALGAMLPFFSAVVLGGGEVPGGALLAGVVIAALVALCTWLAGALRRAQRRAGEQTRERARLLEEGRRREVRLELLAERARISREVHDIVGHSLSGIIAQADGGRFAGERDPRQALPVLEGIAASGREALGDIRGLLGTLRDTPDEGADGPAPGVDDVAALVEQVRAGGLPVAVTVTGTPRPLPGGAGVTVYRAVQEALTNVIKHAGPGTTTRVALAWGDDELRLEVDDDGPSRPARVRPPEGGFGLVGMRERAALQGGRAAAGPRPDGGFAVRVDLPYAPAA